MKYYKSIIKFTTNIGEIMQIISFKDFFQQTNMRKSYKRQIFDYNVEMFSLMVKDNIDIFSSTKI